MNADSENNGKTNEDNVDKRKSIIRRMVARKINTNSFETLEVCAEVTQEIEWSDKAEFQKKSQGVGDLVLIQYKEYEDKVLGTLGLQDKNARTQSSPSRNASFEDNIAPKNNPQTNTKKDDFDDL